MSEEYVTLDDPDQSPPSFGAAVERLAKLEPHEYDQHRKEEADKLGVRVSTLDDAVERLRGVDDDSQPGTGKGLELKSPEPWPDPVDGSALIDDIVALLKRYLAMQDGTPEAVAFWCLFTHAFDYAIVSPYLSIQSPTPRCGKSTLLAAIGLLVDKPLSASNISSSAVFRTIEVAQPTLLLDEAETFTKHNEDLRGILNSGHTKAQAFVIRTAGDDYEPRQFSTWAPKAFASIGGLSGTVEDRSIIVRMRRRGPAEVIEGFRIDRPGEFDVLARKCARWARDNGSKLPNTDPLVPEQLHDRAKDNWRPLIAIAEIIGGEWPARIQNVALALSGTDPDDLEIQVKLLADVKHIYDSTGRQSISPTDLATDLSGMADRPWSEWRRGRPLTANSLSRLLKPFGIKSRLSRNGDNSGRWYELEDFQDDFTRYLPPQSVTTVTPLKTRDNPCVQSVTKLQSVTDCDSENANDTSPVTHVTVQEGGGGEEPMFEDWAS